MMKSSQTITLFGEAPPARWRPSAFLTSIVLHVVAMMMVYADLKHMPKVVDPFSERYTVRLLNLRRPSPKIQMAALRGVAHPARRSASDRPANGGGRPMPLAAARHASELMAAKRTLMQPDVPPNVLMPEDTPIPLAMLWSTENSHAVKVIPPATQEATNANVQPSLDPPNAELKLADLRMSATPFTSDLPMPAPSTSTPLTVRRPDAPTEVPQTGSRPLAPPTPARIVSLSDVLLQQGTVPLPMINETAPSSASDALAVERPANPLGGASGHQTSKLNGTGSGDTSGNQGDAIAANGAPGQNGTGDEASVTRILLPKDGHFGVVVVGSSPIEEYPEAQGVWTDRLAYTVYLHLGLAKSWILQYCLPKDTASLSAGNLTRPDAPWPYVVVRPHLAASDTNGDAILVHGLINTRGQFERLAVVFPLQFPQTQFVLSALQQWQFRPATQDGQITPVEVLLIIPRES